MKLNCYTLLVFMLSNLIVKAQAILPLPYAINFEDSIQNSEWKIFDFNLTPRPWIIKNTYLNDLLSYSNSMYASNDYVWSALQPRIEWLVSPSLDLTIPSFESFKTKIASPNAFDSLSYLAPSFNIGVYLLEGSENPDSASAITEIADFTTSFTGNDDDEFKLATWVELNNIQIPNTNNLSYIAFKYQVQDSALTFHVYLDDIQVTETEVINLANQTLQENKLVVFPNPTFEYLTIESSMNKKIDTVKIYSESGKLVYTKNDPAHILNIKKLLPGLYLMKIQLEGKIIQKKFLKE